MITLKRGHYSFYYYDCLHDIMRQGIYSKYIECEQCSRKDKCVVLRDINSFLKYLLEILKYKIAEFIKNAKGLETSTEE